MPNERPFGSQCQSQDRSAAPGQVPELSMVNIIGLTQFDPARVKVRVVSANVTHAPNHVSVPRTIKQEALVRKKLSIKNILK